MRSLVVAMAMVSVAAPALAQDREAWAERRAARAEQRSQAPQARDSEAQPRADRPHFEPRIETPRAEQTRAEPPRVEQLRIEQPMARQSPIERRRIEQPSMDSQLPQRAERPSIEWRQAPQQSISQQSNGEREPHHWRGERREADATGDLPATDHPHVVLPPAAQQWTGHQRNGSQWASLPEVHRWSNDWQHDPRYDWRRYREHNRSLFRIGSYYDPFGWGYRRVSTGFSLYAGYYSPDYWLDDPWQYRLPPVYGPYRWIRYFDDALLVDLYSGRVVEVIRNFFW